MKLGALGDVLAYIGAVFAGLGAVVGAVITTRSHRREAKASAADLLTEAAERVSHLNTALDRENQRLRKHLGQLTDCVENHLEEAVCSPETCRASLRDCVRVVRETWGYGR